jgi:hypothetical protein
MIRFDKVLVTGRKYVDEPRFSFWSGADHAKLLDETVGLSPELEMKV